MMLPLLAALMLNNPVTMIRMPGNTDPNVGAKPHGFANEALDADDFKDDDDKARDKDGGAPPPPVMAPKPAPQR